MSARAVAVLAAAAIALLSAAPPACADVFGPIELVSQGKTPSSEQVEQAGYAHHAVISGDGGYVAFDGSFGGVKGVWRRELATDTIEQVAPGDAQLPSISEEGRYISFTTNQKLVPGDHNEGPDVYVRDMEIHSSEPCTEESVEQGSCPYELVSAVNGAPEEALTYNSEFPTHYGSLAAGRSAISANGEDVVFITTAESNLDGPNTPPLQVAVHNRGTKHTELVSALIDPATGTPKTVIVNGEERDEPVPTEEYEDHPYGAVFPGGEEVPSFPAAASGPTAKSFGASISADGSTVAWMGQDVGEQTPVLANEALEDIPTYAEPLWRRVNAGPSAPIKAVTGGPVPTSPACVASGETQLSAQTLSEPCQGPFAIEGEPERGLWDAGGASEDVLPQLSKNGERVAILVDRREIASGQEFGQSNGSSDDLYVVDMAEGLSPVQALTRLTEIAGAKADEEGRTAPIVDFDISPDGSQVAFATKRTVFPLGSPALVSEPVAFPGMVELYDADVADGTITRITHGLEGEGQPAEAPHAITSPGVNPYTNEQGTFSPSFSAGGDSLAFSSNADNLVFGDGNAPVGAAVGEFDGSDAFVVSRVPFNSLPTEGQISSPPANPALAPAWKLGVTALSRRNGSVLLEVQVPGDGTLSVAAHSPVVIVPHSRAAAARGHARAAAADVHRTVAMRTVASRSASADASELLPVTLVLAKAYSALAAVHGGLSATVQLVFNSPGHPSVRASVQVIFARPRPKHKAGA